MKHNDKRTKTNKKGAILSIIACLVCSIVSFSIGLSIPRKTDIINGSSRSQEKQSIEDNDSSFIGLYTTSYYQNGSEINGRLVLNKDNDCGSSEKTGCTWKIEETQIIISRYSYVDGFIGRTNEECANLEKEAKKSYKDYKYFKTDPNVIDELGDKKICVISPVTEQTYEILEDGSLLSIDGHTYIKKR